jgi:hypothetical protein
MKRTNCVVLTLAAGLAMTGCSSSGSGAKNTRPATTAAGTTAAAGSASAASTAAATTSAAAASTAAVATGKGACKYVTTAQASALAQSKVKPGVSKSIPGGPVTFDNCSYIFDPGNAPGVLVSIVKFGSNGKTLFAQFRAEKQANNDYSPVSGVGDEAFYASQNLNVRKGNTGFILFVGRNNSYPRAEKGIPDEKKLAALILPQF